MISISYLTKPYLTKILSRQLSRIARSYLIILKIVSILVISRFCCWEGKSQISCNHGDILQLYMLTKCITNLGA